MRTDIIKVRVFIEGIRVPYVNQVSVQTFANETSQASFSLPPIVGFETEELKRARVHIFWSDIETRNSSEDNDWPLLFEGEITGDSYSRSPTGRSHVFYCSGYHTYWEQILLYYWDTSHGSPQHPAFMPSLTVALGNERLTLDMQNAGANLRSRITSFLKENSKISYSSFVKKIYGEALDVNYFYQQADSLLKLSNRFVTPKNENIEALIGRTQLLEVLSKDVMANSGNRSMMETLKSVLEVFRYQIIHNAQPAVIDVAEVERRTAQQRDLDTNKVLQDFEEYLVKLEFDGKQLDSVFVQETLSNLDDGGFSKQDLVNIPKKVVETLGYPSLPNEETARELSIVEARFASADSSYRSASNPTQEGDKKIDEDSELVDLLAQFLIIPETDFALPPTCNVIFPQDQTGFSIERQLMQEPTRALSTPGWTAGLPFNLILAPPELTKAVVPSIPLKPANADGYYRSPIKGKQRISSRFSRARKLKSRHLNAKGRTVPHKGIDIAAGIGTEVYAIDDGVVIAAGWTKASSPDGKIPPTPHYIDGKKFVGKGLGLHVAIKHTKTGIITRYGHLSERSVSEKQVVKAGQEIGKVGSSGSSTGPHLHFETIVNGTHVNPEFFLTIENNKVVPPTPPVKAEEPEVRETEEEKITDAKAAPDSDDNAFTGWRYLTEEEQITGIVPYFDMGTDRAHSFMAFTGAVTDSELNRQLMLNAQYLLRRFQTRSLSALTGPFNPNPIAGFPGLVVDKIRSLIGTITSVNHIISVGGGQGNATTSIQISNPRYWDEGDPYYWKGGVENEDEDNALPVYYLNSLIGTNSFEEDIFEEEAYISWPETDRPVDKLYSQLLGKDVKGIPFHFQSRETNRSTNVVFNKAIDTRYSTIEQASKEKDTNFRSKKRNVNTIVGRYYYFLENSEDGEAAEKFVHDFTKRRGVTETYLMTVLLGAKTSDKGFSYASGPFRAIYQKTILRMLEILAQTQQFRG